MQPLHACRASRSSAACRLLNIGHRPHARFCLSERRACIFFTNSARPKKKGWAADETYQDKKKSKKLQEQASRGSLHARPLRISNKSNKSKHVRAIQAWNSEQPSRSASLLTLRGSAVLHTVFGFPLNVRIISLRAPSPARRTFGARVKARSSWNHPCSCILAVGLEIFFRGHAHFKEGAFSQAALLVLAYSQYGL